MGESGENKGERGTEEPRPLWGAMGEGLSRAGRVLTRAAGQVGASVLSTYRTLDPDLVRHMTQLPLMGLTMLAPGARGTVERVPADGHRAVIFVHGFGGHPGNFLPMQVYFRWRGRTCAYSVAFEEVTGIQEMGDQLRAFVRHVASTPDLPEGASVDLVAHSMGGLVCRTALEDPEIARSVGKLVTLATPHRGTEMARFTQTQTSLDLRPSSELIQRLEGQLPWSSGDGVPELISLWSQSDVVLMPPQSAEVPGAHNVEVEDYTHYTFLLHPDGWRRTFDLLTDVGSTG
ncbi:MAG: alpha/beta fold hydrolase [Myxococcota bacterium]|nr:alpha/beta fold hydrolase [Myxococcota bacterium]